MSEPELSSIRILTPAGLTDEDRLAQRLSSLRSDGLNLSYHKLCPDPSWPFVAGTRSDRLRQLKEALFAPECEFLWAARGGYGASDLLDSLPWEQLRILRPKRIVGFSDISALHLAFYTVLGWTGLHAPMLGTDLWQLHGREDTDTLIGILRKQASDIELPVLYLGRGEAPALEGIAVGGCLSVLSNLIGTQYFPKSLKDCLIYWEDINEHPARLLRYLNQWIQSGALEGVRGLVLGRFMQCEVPGVLSETALREEIARRLPIPVWFCPKFGHLSPNWPLPFGWPMQIRGDRWRWSTQVSPTPHATR